MKTISHSATLLVFVFLDTGERRETFSHFSEEVVAAAIIFHLSSKDSNQPSLPLQSVRCLSRPAIPEAESRGNTKLSTLRTEKEHLVHFPVE